MEAYTRDDIEFFNIFLKIKAKLDNYFNSYYFYDDLSPLFDEGFEKINLFNDGEFKTTAKSLLENIKYLYFLKNFANNT